MTTPTRDELLREVEAFLAVMRLGPTCPVNIAEVQCTRDEWNEGVVNLLFFLSVTDSDSGKPMIVQHKKSTHVLETWPIPNRVFRMLTEIATHELGEAFFVGEERPFYPDH